MDTIEATYDRIWKTRGARFMAHSNYLIQNNYSTFTVGILSVYVIVLSFTFISPTLSAKFYAGDLNLVILAASLVTLVFSQLESSKDYKLKADKMHRNAMELSDIYYEMQAIYFSNDDLNERIKKTELVQRKYNLIIQKCDENHHTYDFDMFLLKNCKKQKFEKGNHLNYVAISLKNTFLRLHYYFKIRWRFFAWVLVPIFVFILVTII